MKLTPSEKEEIIVTLIIAVVMFLLGMGLERWMGG